MTNIDIKTKIKIIDIFLKMRDKAWRLQRTNQDSDPMNNIINEINTIIQDNERIYELSNQYRRFNGLNNQTKYDNLISIIKIMNRLNIHPHIEILLSDVYNFDEIWEAINKDEKVLISENQYIELIETIKRLNTEIIKYEYDFLNFKDNIITDIIIGD